MYLPKDFDFVENIQSQLPVGTVVVMQPKGA